MISLRRTINKIFSVLGYTRDTPLQQQVVYRNFLNLARAYEARLAESLPALSKNDLRTKLLARLLGTAPAEAFYIIQALAKTRNIAGDICEFGVAQGETSALIANEMLNIPVKTLHLFDSFEGLPQPTEKDQLKDDIFALGNMQAYAGAMACPEKMVRTRLAEVGFPEERYLVHKGFIEALSKDQADFPERVSFAYVDFDLYEPIRIALELLHGKTSRGAIVIVDDYDFFSTGVKAAVDEFIDEHNRTRNLYDCFIPDAVYGHFAVLTRQMD